MKIKKLPGLGPGLIAHWCSQVYVVSNLAPAGPRSLTNENDTNYYFYQLNQVNLKSNNKNKPTLIGIINTVI